MPAGVHAERMGDPLRLLSVERLAELWCVSEATVRRWAREGELPAVRIGKCWRFRESDLLRLIEARGE